ncbi:MAG: DUF2927 domain-containing protein [Pseudomonadota bacterium]
MVGSPAKKIAAAIAAFTLVACASAGARDRTGAYYRDLSASLQAAGLMRTEVEAADAAYSNRDLAENFVEIALYTEYDAGVEPRRTPAPLTRWETPIRYRVLGDGATAQDRNELGELAGRLSRLTRLDIRPTNGAANLFVYFLGPEERRDFIAAWRRTRRDEDSAVFYEAWANSIDWPCVFQTFTDEGDERTTGALVLIKAELEGLYRTSCIHEEVVQALGLANDADHVRPSLFNDDEEFALMTRHDEDLLRILYDPRLRPGMTEAEVRPLLPAIVEDLRPGEGS